MFRPKIFVFLFLWSFSVLAQGDVLTLDEAVAEVLAVNPDVQAAHFRSSAAKARIPQAKALEDPMVGVMFEDVPIDSVNVDRGEEINYRVQQNLPFPGKRYVRGKAARFDAKAAEETARGQIGDVILELKKTYYELYRVERALAINRENQGLLRQFLNSTQAWYASGKTTADVPLKAQVEISKLKNEEVLLRQQEITHQSHLKAKLNRATHEDIRLPARVELPRLRFTLDQIKAMALQSRPEIKGLEAMRGRDRAKLTSARQGLLPDFALGFEYNQRPERQDAWTGSAMVNVPLLPWGKHWGEIKETKAMLKATEAEERSITIHTRHEIDQAYSAVKAAEKLAASYRSGILPQAKTMLEAARVAYGSQKTDFLTLIDAARAYKDLQMSFYEVEVMRGTTFAELERLVGMDLTQTNKRTYEKK